MSHKWKTLNVVLFILRKKMRREKMLKIFSKCFRERFMRSNWNMRGVWLLFQRFYILLFYYFQFNPSRKKQESHDIVFKKLSRAFTFCRFWFLSLPIVLRPVDWLPLRVFLTARSADEKSAIKLLNYFRDWKRQCRLKHAIFEALKCEIQLNFQSSYDIA